MFQKTHELNWPVQDDKSQAVKTVVIKTLTMGDDVKLRKKHKDKDTDLLRAFISQSTGLTLSELKRLVSPDYNSIEKQVLELMSANSQPFIEERLDDEIAQLSEKLEELVNSSATPAEIDKVELLIEKAVFNPDSPALLLPIVGDDGQDKTAYTLRPPTVATTDLMEAHNDDWERTLFISTSCTGFSRTELEQMCLPDWNQLQRRLIDFLEKSAEFFRRETSKS